MQAMRQGHFSDRLLRTAQVHAGAAHLEKAHGNSELGSRDPMDSPQRTFAKSVTWQALGLAVMTALTYSQISDLAQSLTIAASGAASGLVLYAVHERLWTRVRWGQVPLRQPGQSGPERSAPTCACCGVAPSECPRGGAADVTSMPRCAWPHPIPQLPASHRSATHRAERV